MSKCPACQAECEPGSRFCMECGASLPPAKAESSVSPRPLSSFGVVQSAMAAQEASNQNPQNAAASSASPMAKAPLGATIPQKQVIPSPSKSLKVDISKQAAASSESPKETQPLSKPTASATLERPFSSASTNSAPLTAAIASPVDASKPTAETTRAASEANNGNAMPNNTGELHKWVENSVAQWSDSVSESSSKAPAPAASHVANAKQGSSLEPKQSGASTAAAAPFSSAFAAADKVAPPQVAPQNTAAPRTTSTRPAASAPRRQPVVRPQLEAIAQEEQDSKVKKNFYSGLALGCCGGMALAIVSILIFLIFVGAALND